VLPLAPWLAVGASAGLFTAWVEYTPRLIGAQGPQYALTFFERLLLAGRVPWFYAWKALWPVNVMFVYPRWKIDSGSWWQYLFPVGLAALAIVLVFLARKHRGPLAAFLLFTGTLFPVLGFFNVYPFRYSYVADHFQYLAILAIVVPAASGLAALSRRISPHRLARLALPLLLLATLAAATWRRSGVYRDYETLFRDSAARNPASALARNNLGVILMSTGREPEAAGEFQAAVRIEPDNPEYRVNYGLALAQMPGRLPDAIAEYRTALQADPESYSAHLNLGLALMSIPGRRDEAIAEYRKAIAATHAALRRDPNFWQAHLNLGIACGQIPGREAEAIKEFRIALEMKPDSALARFHLGNTFHKMGRLPEAIAEYQASLSIDPGVPEVHYELAYALAQIPGRVPEAIAACRRMLLLKPDDKPGQELMASLLEYQRTRGPAPAVRE
jgi:tetratricopeptide (TPR) repeat protein